MGKKKGTVCAGVALFCWRSGREGLQSNRRTLLSTSGARATKECKGKPKGVRESSRWQILIEAGRNYNAVSGLGGKCSWRLIRPERNRSWAARQRRSSERQGAAARGPSSPPPRASSTAAALSEARVALGEGAEGAVARAAPLRPPLV